MGCSDWMNCNGRQTKLTEKQTNRSSAGAFLAQSDADLWLPGTGCWDVFRFRKRTPVFSTEPIICPAPMAVEAGAYRWAGCDRGLSLLLCGKSIERGYRQKIQKNQTRPVSVRDLHRCDRSDHPYMGGHHGMVCHLSGTADRSGGRACGSHGLSGCDASRNSPAVSSDAIAFRHPFCNAACRKTRYPKWMLAFHPVTGNLLLAAVPDIAQAMQVPVATWMSVMSQSSTNSAILIWCIAAAVYERKRSACLAGR